MNMKIGILGTGIVGTTLASHLLEKGHQVMMGSRNGSNEGAAKPASKYNGRMLEGTFADAASFGSVVFHCVMGIHSIDAARVLDRQSLTGKTIIDVTNPLDFSFGMPPRLTICNDNSSGEQLQELLPGTNVVKAFNTVPYNRIVNAGMVNNKNVDMFICGNDKTAKEQVTELITREFGWNRENIIDLGEIKHARSTEALLPFFASVAMRFGTFGNMIKIYRN
jgi:predicted dinucleotide-binding enzyme